MEFRHVRAVNATTGQSFECDFVDTRRGLPFKGAEQLVTLTVTTKPKGLGNPERIVIEKVGDFSQLYSDARQKYPGARIGVVMRKLSDEIPRKVVV